MIKGKGTYKVLINGKINTYDNWNKLPLSFENLILFNPHWKEGPHSHEDHLYYDTFSDKLDELMKRETKK